MTKSTAAEQLMLELVNRARMDPAAEAERQGIGLNDGLAAGKISKAPKEVLAGNDLLRVAAANHSRWMLGNDRFDHTESSSFPDGRTGETPADRMDAAGYQFRGSSAWGENISWIGAVPGPIDLGEAIVEQHHGLFLSPGHRTNILSENFREIGISQQHGDFRSDGTDHDASMVTQNFARSGTTLFVTGVVYDDKDGDDFFSIGEQTAGRKVFGSGGIADKTGSGGGYALGFTTAGAKTVAFSLASGSVSVSLTLGDANAKIDLVSGKEIWTNASLSVQSGKVGALHALGIEDVGLTGGKGSETIVGNKGKNVLSGGKGADLLDGGAGSDTLKGGSGADAFLFDSKLNAKSNVDRIADFAPDHDVFRLDGAVFKGFADGALAEKYFQDISQQQAGKNDRILYDAKSGDLFFDRDGSGSKYDAIKFAHLDNLAALSAGDFLVV